MVAERCLCRGSQPTVTCTPTTNASSIARAFAAIHASRPWPNETNISRCLTSFDTKTNRFGASPGSIGLRRNSSSTSTNALIASRVVL